MARREEIIKTENTCNSNRIEQEKEGTKNFNLKLIAV